MPARKNHISSDEAHPTPTKKTTKIEAKAPVEPLSRKKGLTVVGIGASAGGLKALSSFFGALPTNTGMAFVVVTHLHPQYESHMAELLQPHTRMPTMQVNHKTRVEPNQVYVIPPNRTIIMTDTHLDVEEFDQPHGRRTPVDYFFRSMAQSGHSDPVAIILSGGGTDGSVGIKDIKEVGGLIMVQHPDEAEYDGMPRAALTTGLVDVTLPADQLAEKLASYIQFNPMLPHDPGQLTDTDLETLQRILGQVHARTGHDFSQYKRATVLRRVQRRMQLNSFTTLDAYLAHLRGNAGEAQAMFNDILIGVTNFFRDHDSWSALTDQVIPALFQQKRDRQETIRVWTVGCATGEEAYGLAMLLFEEAARQDGHRQIQVFASDLDERSITHARDGLYPASIEADVSSERLERFFTREGEYYRVKHELREAVLFTNHNLLRDPPFSRQDLVACRNVLIYLQRTIQDRVFETFHYALHPDGYLFLGRSETAEHLPELFRPVDKSHRIYQAKSLAVDKAHMPAMPPHLQRYPRTSEFDTSLHPLAARLMEDPAILEQQHQRALESFGPPSIMVNDRYGILHVSESAGRYLHQPKGPITSDLLTLVLPELQPEMRSALFHAFDKSKATVSRPVNVHINGHTRRVVISVRPRPVEPDLESMPEKQALVLFIEDELQDTDGEAAERETPRTELERDDMIVQLQAEIQRLREQLQITVEEYRSSNEEMKAANEELQSINEEYRSATEELETSKEELQSVNEELQTVNNEMRNKLEEISKAHKELESLMGATEIATLYLDRGLRIQRFTAGVQELFNMMDVDRGRRISDLTHKMGYNEFVDDAEVVLRKLIPVEREVQRADGNWFLVRLRPYRTVEDHIEGLVISFIDINLLKQAEQELMQSKATLEERVRERTRELDEANQKLRQGHDLFFGLFNANPIPTALTRMQDDVFLNVNDEFIHYFHVERDALIGVTSEKLGLGIGLGRQPKLDMQTREEFVNLIKTEGRVKSYETEIIHPSGEARKILASLQYIKIDDTDSLITTFIDITDRVRAEQRIRALAAELTTTEQEERQRLAQILHDDLQQRIFAIQMQLSFLRDAYEKNDLKAFEADFPRLERWLTEAIQVTRQLSVDLSPPILHGEGLYEAVIWLTFQMNEQYGLNVNVKPNGREVELEEKLRVLLFYAVREVLFNVVKHADILEAAVTLEQKDEYVQIVIRDEGKGFDSQAVLNNTKETHGLLTLRHRLNLLGCTLQVNSQPGEGTEVTIEIPYERPGRSI